MITAHKTSYVKNVKQPGELRYLTIKESETEGTILVGIQGGKVYQLISFAFCPV